jgi:AAA+ superfamily predicted ATPase
MVNTTQPISTHAAFNDLLPLLQRFDIRLEYAVAAAEIAYGKSAATDPYRGLHLHTEDAHRSLSHAPGIPLFHPDAKTELPADFVPANSRLARLQQQFELSEFDIEIIAIALAPELDRRYDRLYAYLQDDVRCQRPSVDLALNLLCPDAAEKLARRIHFAPEAPLIHHNILHLVANSNPAKPTLLGHELHLDEQVVRFLLAQPGLDPRLAPFCQWVQPAVSPHPAIDPTIQPALSAWVNEAWQTRQPLRLYFQGSDRSLKRHIAETAAAEADIPLLVVDLARLVAAEPKLNLESSLALAIREAQFQEAMLYIDELDALQTNDRAYPSLLQSITKTEAIVILSGTQPWQPADIEPLGIVSISLPLPDATQRQHYWQMQLAAAGVALDNSDIRALATRFRLNPNQIADAVATACNTAQWQMTRDLFLPGHSQPKIPQLSTPKLANFFAAARTQCGHELSTLTQKVEPKYGFDDIVLPDDRQTQLWEICHQAKYQNLVYQDWGFESKLSLGKGLNVLFSGLPGTGKTMAAEAIAHELQLDLYKIDLSQVVSKYIGETEKNLNRIFNAATNSNAILLFDEADALFGKRSEIRDSHDRYANIEIGYLLQKMEEYEGIAILTTNLRSNLDDAFVRRLRFIIEFPVPNEKHRRQIWEKIFPKSAPCSPDLDLDLLAKRFEICGANIRNVALAAAFLAANEGETIEMGHVVRSLRREYQKMGKILMEYDLQRKN